MPRQFTDARLLISDLLDRHEGGTDSPIAYPDYDGFADVAQMDKFVRDLRDAEGRGGIRINRGRGLKSEQIKHVRLVNVSLAYELLGRRPVRELMEVAIRLLLEGLDLPVQFDGPLESLRSAWSRGREWQGFSLGDADRLKPAFAMAKAIFEHRHVGLDYRTFSRRFAGDSKALERLEGPVVRLLGGLVEVPPAARPRDALRTLGLEKFAPPMLLSGRIDFDMAEMSTAAPTYFGIPPAEAARLRFRDRPEYVLTIENFASFSRHIVEADPQRAGITIFVGGYPSLATQDALKTIATALPAEIPFLHWSDIDPDGTWIFRTIETSIGRDLKPHLMSADLADSLGKLPAERTRLPAGAMPSAIADLVAYLRRDDAKWLEQEELDPRLPNSAQVSTIQEDVF